jgi:hypothetical protein
LRNPNERDENLARGGLEVTKKPKQPTGTEKSEGNEVLPPTVVERDEKTKTFRIRLERLKEDTLFDQVSISKAGQGCFNNPGGPTC